MAKDALSLPSDYFRQRIAGLRELSVEVKQAAEKMLSSPERDELLKFADQLDQQVADAEHELAVQSNRPASKAPSQKSEYRIFPRPPDDEPK